MTRMHATGGRGERTVLVTALRGRASTGRAACATGSARTPRGRSLGGGHGLGQARLPGGRARPEQFLTLYEASCDSA